MIKLGITGCCGRMGQRILDLSKKDKAFGVKALFERPDHPMIGKTIDGIPISSDLADLKDVDVLIDYTLPTATEQNVAACVRSKTKLVIGTTGLTDAQLKLIKNASRKTAIVQSTNTSIGVNIFFKLAKILGEKTDKAYNVRIVEAHHIHKKDAPSGTAKTLAKIIEAAHGMAVSNIQSIREDEIVGDHDVVFESDVDTITIRHHAKTRDIFVKGALIAAKFLSKKKTGLFDAQDALGLK